MSPSTRSRVMQIMRESWPVDCKRFPGNVGVATRRCATNNVKFYSRAVSDRNVQVHSLGVSRVASELDALEGAS